MTPELADRVVATRERAGTFGSVEELSMLAELPPVLTEALGEYAIFLP
jgi:DNA uptake protein ComE-like DNA-binding protein